MCFDCLEINSFEMYICRMNSFTVRTTDVVDTKMADTGQNLKLLTFGWTDSSQLLKELEEAKRPSAS